MIKKIFCNDVEIGISDNNDGNMRFFGGVDENDIIKNQEKIAKIIGLSGKKVARIRTIYNDRKNFTSYQEISKENIKDYSILNPEEQIPISDGLVTRIPEVGILLPLADCLGAVVFDEKQKIVGLLHAGRQNVEQNGPKEFIKYFINNYGSDIKELKIFFSPYAMNYCIYKLNDKKLGEAAKEQFISAGIMSENIIDPKIDTVSNDDFPSNSGGDTFKRFAIVVKITKA